MWWRYHDEFVAVCTMTTGAVLIWVSLRDLATYRTGYVLIVGGGILVAWALYECALMVIVGLHKLLVGRGRKRVRKSPDGFLRYSDSSTGVPFLRNRFGRGGREDR